MPLLRQRRLVLVRPRVRYLVLVVIGVLLAASTHALPGPRSNTGNVPITAGDAVRVQTLAALITQALADLETSGTVESGGAFSRRLASTERFLLRVAWFESVGLYRRQQGAKGPARSLYQIEPIRALAGCRMAVRRGWMDELAAACGQPEAVIGSACATLTASGWPRANLVEECLRTNDLFATYLARICLEPVPALLPGDPHGQAELWAATWKRVFGSPAQREQEKAAFVRAAVRVDQLLPP